MWFDGISLGGNMALNEKYTEILKLAKMLEKAGIDHTLKRFKDGWQVIYYFDDVLIADAVETCTSYGHEEDLLEIMGCLTPEEEMWDSVLGYLSAENVFDRFMKDFKEREGLSNEN